MVDTRTNPTTERKIERTTEPIKMKETIGDTNVSTSISSLTEHMATTGHRIDWAQVRILWGDQIPHGLLVKESLVIQTHQPCLNRATYSVSLLIYPEGLDRKLVPDPHR